MTPLFLRFSRRLQLDPGSPVSSPPLPGNDAGNLLVVGHVARSAHRLLFCRICHYRFSEFKGTSLFNSKLPHDKILAILRHLAEGCSVRQTARLVGVSKDTVTQLAQATHDE